jgi:hypothetical protein
MLSSVNLTVPYIESAYRLANPSKRLKLKISLLQAVEAPRVAGGQGSHIT